MLRAFIALLILTSLSAVGRADGQQSRFAETTVEAPVRIYPDLTRTPLATLPAGTEVMVLEVQGDWVRVSFKDTAYGDRVGYIRAVQLRGISAPPRPSGRLSGDDPVAKPAVPAMEPNRARPSSELGSAKPPPLPPNSGPTARSMPAVDSNVSTKAKADSKVFDRSSGSLSDAAVADAIRIGMRQRGRTQGLILLDMTHLWTSAVTAGVAAGVNQSATAPTAGFHLQVYTPLAWIRQLGSDAAREYRQLSENDLGEEAREDVLRVTVYPNTPSEVSARGMVGTSSVQHVVLRDESRHTVIQPIFKEEFTEESANAMGGKATFTGVRVKFPMAAVRELQGRNRDHEFFITVVGNAAEKDFKVKKKHFDELPQ